MQKKNIEKELQGEAENFGERFVMAIDELPVNSLTVNQANIITVPLRDLVMFPMLPVPVQVSRETSIKAIKTAVEEGEGIFLICQTNPDEDNPSENKDFHETGVIAHVVRFINGPEGVHTLFCMPLAAARFEGLSQDKPFLRSRIKEMKKWDVVPKSKETEFNLVSRMVVETYENLLQFVDPERVGDVKFGLDGQSNIKEKIKFILVNSPLSVKERQALLDIGNEVKRVRQLLSFLDTHCQEMELRAAIAEKSQVEMTHQQKVDFLQRQIKTMQDEIAGVSEDDDVQTLRKRSEMKSWNEAAAAHFNKELAKLGRLNPHTPDYSVQYAYLDTFLNLPWDEYSQEDLSLAKIEQTLNRDHYGLKEVKERILEQMAVIKLRGDMKAPILCLYGPPGVGKTSLGKSIAEAMGREYARVSLGGLNDEAEIRGHRRTYIGAMPGRVLKAIEKAGKGNPVIVLDEIDKIGNSYKGDPSTAMLEVLDPEQNDKFHDNYLDFDYDLSKVLFIATANNLSTLSAPLLDRMEIINISGYSTEEKIEIARRHLIPKAMRDNGLGEESFTFNRNAIEYIIEHYTRENGVRQLEKKIGKVLRKLAVKKAKGESLPVKINKDSILTYLGKEEVMPEMYESNDCPGVVTGLAWTSVGGDILFIESSLSDGKGEKLTLTGNLGNVMKESATIAMQYIKANASIFRISQGIIEKKDVHIHVPEGAIPKDGPSAGITMVTSLVSSFTGHKVREKTAMTGEITLRGKVLPVGGIKEKILAARRAGITDIILSSANRKDIEEINPDYVKGMSFHYVETIYEVIRYAIPGLGLE